MYLIPDGSLSAIPTCHFRTAISTLGTAGLPIAVADVKGLTWMNPRIASGVCKRSGPRNYPEPKILRILRPGGARRAFGRKLLKPGVPLVDVRLVWDMVGCINLGR